MMSKSAFATAMTVQKISKNITLLLSDSPVRATPPSDRPKPLLLLLPWLGSQPKSLFKYCDIYFRTGFDVLVAESEVSDFLWPRRGLEHGARILEVLQRDTFVSRPLLVHAFSIGGYTMTQMFLHISKEPEKYQDVSSRIKGHIYDSLVIGSLDHMATGLGRSVFPQWEGLVRQVSLLYFRVFRKQTVDYFNAAISVFWKCPVAAPALFFYCENDPMCDHQTMDELVEFWRERNVTVKNKKWKESVHAGHLRQHPQEYLATLEDFLCSTGLVPLKAKI